MFITSKETNSFRYLYGIETRTWLKSVCIWNKTKSKSPGSATTTSRSQFMTPICTEKATKNTYANDKQTNAREAYRQEAMWS